MLLPFKIFMRIKFRGISTFQKFPNLSRQECVKISTCEISQGSKNPQRLPSNIAIQTFSVHLKGINCHGVQILRQKLPREIREI